MDVDRADSRDGQSALPKHPVVAAGDEQIGLQRSEMRQKWFRVRVAQKRPLLIRPVDMGDMLELRPAADDIDRLPREQMRSVAEGHDAQPRQGWRLFGVIVI